MGAFKGTVEKNEFQYKLDKDILNKENAMIYTIMNYKIYNKETGNIINNYKVKRIGFLYFTKDYGEA